MNLGQVPFTTASILAQPFESITVSESESIKASPFFLSISDVVSVSDAAFPLIPTYPLSLSLQEFISVLEAPGATVGGGGGTGEGAGGAVTGEEAEDMMTLRWYPIPDPSVPKPVWDALRRSFDMIYENSDQMGPTSVTAQGTDTMELASSYAPVPGCQIKLTRNGMWTVTGSILVNVIGAGDVGKLIEGSCWVQGNTQVGTSQLKVQAQPTTLTISHSWTFKGKTKQTVKLQAKKESGATGTSNVDGKHSSITAIWQGRR
jgi:hypothetical protein